LVLLSGCSCELCVCVQGKKEERRKRDVLLLINKNTWKMIRYMYIRETKQPFPQKTLSSVKSGFGLPDHPTHPQILYIP
jgi:hypothetical protein